MPDSFSEIRKKALSKAKQKVKESVNPDLMIINAINNIEELDKIINVMASRLREWFAIQNPLLERMISDNEKLIQIVLETTEPDKEMGKEFSADDEKAVKALAAAAHTLVQTKYFLLTYLEKVMLDNCKNVLVLAGPTIGARLLREAGSLKRMASLQSSTIQLLGAEKALFRHIKTGAKSPKYGHIINHPLIIKAKKDEKGKAARALADKLSICARLDYFKGEFKAKEYLDELTTKFS